MSGHAGIMRAGVEPVADPKPLTRDEYDGLLRLLYRASATTDRSDKLVPPIYHLAYQAALEQWHALAPLPPQ